MVLKNSKAKKVATPIQKPGSTSVDPLNDTKKAIEAKLINNTEIVKAEVDDKCPGRNTLKVIQH